MVTFNCQCNFSKIFMLLSLSLWPSRAVCGEQVAFVEVFVHEQDVSGSVLEGEVLKGSLDGDLSENEKDHDLRLDLRLINNEEAERSDGTEPTRQSPWIGVVSVGVEDGAVSTGSQESFAAAVVSKMKRALVLGASALIILVLNQNTVRETDLSEVLSKPVVIIQSSENVTRLIGALLRGLHATAKITYRTFLQSNLGATLTLWSSCGRSRGGLYGEWQGVICTGETNSPVQKYLQQLWDTVVLAALILSTGVIVQARWQYQDNDDLEVNSHGRRHPKQDLLKRLSVLQTRTYRTNPGPTAWSDTHSCAVCLEQYSNNQCLRVLPCLHEFHRDCVDPWLHLQQTCPLCKRSILGNFC